MLQSVLPSGPCICTTFLEEFLDFMVWEHHISLHPVFIWILHPSDHVYSRSATHQACVEYLQVLGYWWSRRKQTLIRNTRKSRVIYRCEKHCEEVPGSSRMYHRIDLERLLWGGDHWAEQWRKSGSWPGGGAECEHKERCGHMGNHVCRGPKGAQCGQSVGVWMVGEELQCRVRSER